MRLGEILTLPWNCVDFGRGLITVVNPKNGKSRKVPMNELLARAIQNKPKTSKDGIFVFADPESGKPEGSGKNCLPSVFTARRDLPNTVP
jgi:integrase